MIGIFERLLAGDTRIASQFATCKAFWEDFFKNHKTASDEELARALSIAEAHIESDIFNLDRGLAYEAMPITCFGSLYDEYEGWRDPEKKAMARRLAKAFENSRVSIEVKDFASVAAKLFYVHD